MPVKEVGSWCNCEVLRRRPLLMGGSRRGEIKRSRKRQRKVRQGASIKWQSKKRHNLRIEQSLTEAWNTTTSLFSYIDLSGDRLTHIYIYFPLRYADY